MVKHCVNGTLDDSNYSSPMPVIGLYIAGATLVCFIFLFCDIYAGLRKGKRWLPCRFFSLNSLTLTLVAVAAKLPVDLTTSMPRAVDQLSKLTGTTLICVCMAFFMPSLATMSRGECFSNLAALSIFVITVIVNVCIQMKTGVIYTFFVEHVIVLVSMFLLLVWLWFISFEIVARKLWRSNLRGFFFVDDSRSMMAKLKLCYVFSRKINLEFDICLTPFSATVGMFSTLCSALLTEAVVRSLVFRHVKFCKGESDYKWSMWMVVVSQIITVMLGCLGNLFRWISLDHHMEHTYLFVPNKLYLDFKQVPKVLLRRLTKCIWVMVVCISGLLGITSLIVAIAFVWVREHIPIFFHKRYDDVGAEEEIIHPFGGEKWIVRICLKDMNRWMAANQRKPLTHLINLLSEPPSSPESVSDFAVRFQFGGYKLSCLSVVILVKEVTDLSPNLSKSLTRSLDDAFQIIYFIDGQMGENDKRKLELAKKLWKGGVLNINKNVDLHYVQKVFVDIEFEFVQFIQSQGGNLIQVYVDMLHYFLVKLPHAIVKDLMECSLDQLEKRTKHAIQVLIKLEPLENQIHWEFPEKLHCRGLITRLPANDNHGTTHRESNEPPLPAQPIEDHNNEFDDVTSEIQQVV